MRNRVWPVIAAAVLLTAVGCADYSYPYLSLDLKAVYDTSDIQVNYTYVCEEDDQYCAYSLWDKADSETALTSFEGVMSHSGEIDFSELELDEGDYILDFDIYTELDGEYILLKFISDSFEFSIDFP